MIKVVAHNILSPLGKTTEENYQNVLRGHSGLRQYEGKWKLPFPLCASLFKIQNSKFSILNAPFESLVLDSVKAAIGNTPIDEDTCFILSTTKGNLSASALSVRESAIPSRTARFLSASITSKLGIKTDPIIVCNACISGVAAIILAQRLLFSRIYKRAIVCGCDVLGRFITSGFESLKALSPEPCRPFDIERLGLNLGEAAATLVLEYQEQPSADGWYILNGATSNDAYHISSPSPKGEGCARAIMQACRGIDTESLAVINAHGTATMYNDQMESKAIETAGLTSVPVNALKGCYGHTLGAAGLLETILTMRAIDDGIILPTKGFQERGVSGKIDIVGETRQTDKRSFLKIISGFGGCNAALVCSKAPSPCTPPCTSPCIPSAFLLRHPPTPEKSPIPPLGGLGRGQYKVLRTVTVSTSKVLVDGEEIETTSSGKTMLTEVYKTYVGNYPRFYKMDMLSRLGLIASELLLKEIPILTRRVRWQENEARWQEAWTPERCAIVLFNSSSSACADKVYEQTIKEENYYPSPAAFVYTLPNIVTGEIAMRHGIKGETSFYILKQKNEKTIKDILYATMLSSQMDSMITGWIDCADEENFEAELKLVIKWKN